MMFNTRSGDRNNYCGTKVATMRKEQEISQNTLAKRLSALGFDIKKNEVQRIESGKRFVTDIEIKIIAKYFGISIDELMA